MSMNPPLSHPGPDVAARPGDNPARRNAAPIPRRKALGFFLAGMAALLVFERTHFKLCLVKGESMLPGLHSGDLLIVDKRAYRNAEPQRGDIVVASDEGELLVKRVVGLPGEELELRLGELRVNRQPYAEDYPVESGRLSLRKGRLLDDRYALLGDNRSVTVTTSVHAVVAKHQILGKVIRSFHLGGGRRQQDSDRAT